MINISPISTKSFGEIFPFKYIGFWFIMLFKTNYNTFKIKHLFYFELKNINISIIFIIVIE